MNLDRGLRIVMFSQKVDENDWLQSFTVDWIRALAKQTAQVRVIALEQRAASFPANVTVHSLGKERGVGRIGQFTQFQRLVGQFAPTTDIFFGHLTPRYTWLAAPLAALRHVPQCLWYTHQHAGPELRMALGVARWVATAAPGSFPIPHRKVHILGHGVDANRFTLDHTRIDPMQPPLVLAVGRIAPIKHHHILLEAAAKLRDQGVEARFAVAGGTATIEGERYKAQIEARIAVLDMHQRFRFLGPLHGPHLIDQLHRASIVTNLSPAGLFDKAALEAMMTARPVLVTNPAFDELLGDHSGLLRASAPDATAEITTKLAGLLRLSPQKRDQIGDDLHDRAIRAHGLDSLISRLVALWQS